MEYWLCSLGMLPGYIWELWSREHVMIWSARWIRPLVMANIQGPTTSISLMLRWIRVHTRESYTPCTRHGLMDAMDTAMDTAIGYGQDPWADNITFIHRDQLLLICWAVKSLIHSSAAIQVGPRLGALLTRLSEDCPPGRTSSHELWRIRQG